MKRMITIACMVLPLAGCAVETSTTHETFTIIQVKPPKRLYVDVVDSLGRSYHVYVSKRCSNWRQIKIGSKVVLNRETTRYDDGSVSTSVRVRSSSDVCPR